MNDMPFTLPEPPGADEVRKLRAALWQKGYSPVPVRTDGKSTFYSDWPEQARAGEFAAIDCTFDPALASTGIDCAGLRAIDIDVDDQALVDAICAAAEDVGLPEAGGVRFRENSSRVLWLYRAAEGRPLKRTLPGAKGKKSLSSAAVSNPSRTGCAKIQACRTSGMPAAMHRHFLNACRRGTNCRR